MDLLDILIFNKLKNLKGGGGVTPTGTINITQNGETDVTNYATANVQVVPSFPHEFLSYIIQSSGEYINTGFGANETEYTIECKCRTKASTNGFILGNFETIEGNPQYGIGALYYSNTSPNRLKAFYADNQESNIDYFGMNTDNIIVAKFSTTKIEGTFNGTAFSFDVTSSPNNSNLAIFKRCIGETNFPGYLTFYYLRIYDKNNNLVRYFVPAKDNQNTICLFDMVSGTYYYNQGTGAFTGA